MEYGHSVQWTVTLKLRGDLNPTAPRNHRPRPSRVYSDELGGDFLGSGLQQWDHKLGSSLGLAILERSSCEIQIRGEILSKYIFQRMPPTGEGFEM